MRYLATLVGILILVPTTATAQEIYNGIELGYSSRQEVANALGRKVEDPSSEELTYQKFNFLGVTSDETEGSFDFYGFAGGQGAEVTDHLTGFNIDFGKSDSSTVRYETLSSRLTAALGAPEKTEVSEDELGGIALWKEKEWKLDARYGGSDAEYTIVLTLDPPDAIYKDDNRKRKLYLSADWDSGDPF